MLWLANFKGYSQQLTLINTDTAICFSIQQGKYLLKQVYTANHYALQDSLNNLVINSKDSIINNQEYQIKNYNYLLTSKDSLNSVCELKLDGLSLQNKVLNGRVKKEKRAKITALFAGIISTTVMATLYLTK